MNQKAKNGWALTHKAKFKFHLQCLLISPDRKLKQKRKKWEKFLIFILTIKISIVLPSRSKCCPFREHTLNYHKEVIFVVTKCQKQAIVIKGGSLLCQLMKLFCFLFLFSVFGLRCFGFMDTGYHNYLLLYTNVYTTVLTHWYHRSSVIVHMWYIISIGHWASAHRRYIF